MTTWFRRNRWALLALVVLIPAALAAALSINSFRYYGEKWQQAVMVAEGDSGQYVPERPRPVDENGDDIPGASPEPAPPATLTLEGYVVVSWDSEVGRDVGLHEGSEAVSALIRIDATGMPDDVYGCDAILTAPGPMGEREWRIGSSPDIDYYPSGDLSAYCDLKSGGELLWEAVFVVPEGVGETAELFIIRGSASPERVLRLEH